MYLLFRLVCPSCPSINAVVLENIQRYPYNFDTLMKGAIESSLLSMKCIPFIVHLKWHSKEYRYIIAYRKKAFALHFIDVTHTISSIKK